MKILFSVLFALALSVAVMAQSQDQSSGQTNQGSQNSSGQNQANTTGNQNNSQKMSGTVSNDGKTFTNDQNSKTYHVDNPQALKGEENQHVAVLVQYDPYTNVIHIVQIEQP